MLVGKRGVKTSTQPVEPALVRPVSDRKTSHATDHALIDIKQAVAPLAPAVKNVAIDHSVLLEQTRQEPRQVTWKVTREDSRRESCQECFSSTYSSARLSMSDVRKPKPSAILTRLSSVTLRSPRSMRPR
ncbi:hypothetical protein GCM10011404_04080 [Sphingomonas prati]|nr:hypothetical protein GCM10011404_04080 [Sphingomonas prati]